MLPLSSLSGVSPHERPPGRTVKDTKETNDRDLPTNKESLQSRTSRSRKQERKKRRDRKRRFCQDSRDLVVALASQLESRRWTSQVKLVSQLV